MSEHRAFLSTLPAGRGQRRLALGVVVAGVAVFLAAAPFAKTPLAQVPAFLPLYQSALVICDLITAVLLFGQYRILRAPALLALACGYLFGALMAVCHTLSFPGLFAPGGLMGSGPQTTAWIYFLWHGVFPLFVIAYALLAEGAPRETPGRARGPILLAIAGAAATAFLLVMATTWGHDALPGIMQGDKDASTKVFVATATWALSLVALAAVWRHRTHSILDLWVMVVMCAWIFDVALASVLNQGRYDLGWYAGRVYGLAAASFVLMVLLLENGALYARLAESLENERRERRLVQQRTAELTAANKDLETFSYSVSHDLRSPLRAVDGYARMLVEDCGEQLDAEARRLLGVINQSTKRMERLIDDLLKFSRMGRSPLQLESVNLDALTRQVVAEVQAGNTGRSLEFRIAGLGSVQADPALLRQVLSNLVGNAVKYSRGRDPAVIEIGRRDEPDGSASFHVRDNGAGFDMKHSGKLFGVFQRLHRADEFEGTGVGLAIVHRIVTRHGGQIRAESAPGAGATFHFTLPAADSAAQPSDEATAARLRA